MPSLTAELAGIAAVVVALLVVAIVVDPTLRARRAANRLARQHRHAAQGCTVCATALLVADFEARVADLNAQLDRLQGARR